MAADTLRSEHPDVPIVGVEPALKPAALAPHHRHILVMATNATVHLDKFHKLAREYGSRSQITAIPCVGLADCIEKGDFEGPELHGLLERLVGEYRGAVDSVVLGCTHYPFVKRQIAEVLGDVPFYDGSAGTARQTRRLLEGGMLAPESQQGGVEFFSSNEGTRQIELYRWFLAQPI